MALTTFCRRQLASKIHNCQHRRNVVITDKAQNSDEYKDSKVKSYEDIPGPPSLPILGALAHYLPFGQFFGKTPLQIYNINRKKYGDIYKENILHLPMIHVFDPDDFETVFRSDGKYPIREAFMTLAHYNKHYNNGLQGVITGQNETWHELRSKFQQKILKPKAVAAYFGDHASIGDELLEKIKLSINDDGIVDDMRSDIHKFATDCVSQVCFNKRFNLLLAKEENAEALEFFDAVKVIMDTGLNEFRRLPLYKLFNTPSFQKFVQAQNFIRLLSLKYSKEALAQMNERENNGESIDGEQGDLIPYLISKTELSEEKVFNVIGEIFFVGVDTTSYHIGFMLYILGTHLEIQETLYQEIKEITAGNTLCANDVSKMSYLKAVDKEVHRLLPVVPGTIRTLSQDINLKGFHIPKGNILVLHWCCSATDEKYFKDASEFKPERWLRDQDNKNEIHPFASLPFGYGARSCIGRRIAEQESFIAIVKILQKYQVKYVGENLEIDYSVLFAPGNKMQFQFVPRKT